MKIKVLKNFSCNGIKKKKGDFVSKEESEAIGEEHGNDLMKGDFVRVIDPKVEKEKSEKLKAEKLAHDKANAEKSAKIKAKREAESKKQHAESKGK